MQARSHLVPFIFAAAATIATAASAQQVVKIGHVAPMSGASAHLGKDNENGARMAIDELNAKGFAIDGKRVVLQLINEDDAADPKQGTAVAQKLVDAGVSGVIGHLNSGTTVPASRIYHQAGIPQISPAATTPQYTKQGFATAYRVVANDAKLGGALGRYAVVNMKAQKIAVIDDRSAYGQGVADEFSKAVKLVRQSNQMVAREFTNPNATDFSAILTSIKAKQPDLIFFGGMDSVAAPLLKQMKALGISAKLMGGDGICTEALSRLAGPSIGNGVVTCAEAGGVEGLQEKAMENFRSRYREKYNAEVQLYAPYVYDAVMVMAGAMQAAKSAEPAKYLPALKKISHQGVTGTIGFDANGDIKNGAVTFYTYRNNDRVKLAVIR
jgi:branched-chain amino acid transport system substrate-binding protein